MTKSKEQNSSLPSADELEKLYNGGGVFATQEDRDSQGVEVITLLDPEIIDPFPNHPFKVSVDEIFLSKVEKRGGVTQPTIIRPHPNKQGRYQMIAGHRRQESCKILGYQVPCINRNLSDSEAILEMADSNLTSRDVILPSEKARAYKMYAEAEKKQGFRSDLTSGTNGRKLNTTEKIGKLFGDYERDVRRHIRLNFLIPEILKMVDDSRIKLRPAEPLTYLKEEEQIILLDLMEFEGCTPSEKQSLLFKKLSENETFTEESALEILQEEKSNQKEQFKIPQDKIRRFFREGTPKEKIEDTIIKALEHYKRYQDKQKANQER